MGAKAGPSLALLCPYSAGGLRKSYDLYSLVSCASTMVLVLAQARNEADLVPAGEAQGNQQIAFFRVVSRAREEAGWECEGARRGTAGGIAEGRAYRAEGLAQAKVLRWEWAQ